MHNHRNALRFFPYLFYHGKIKPGFCQIDAVGRPERTCQCINPRLFHKLFCLNGIGINLCIISGAGAIVSRTGLPASHGTQFRLHGCPGLWRHFHCFFHTGYIFFIRQSGTVKHNAGKADIQYLLYIFQCFSMIQVHADGHRRLFGTGDHDRPDDGYGHKHFMALGSLDDYRKLQFLRCIQYGHQAFQIGCVECAYRNLFFFCNFQDFF